MSLVNLTGSDVTLSTWTFGEVKGKSVTIPANDNLVAARDQQAEIPCIRTIDVEGMFAGYLYPTFIGGGPLMAEGSPLPPREIGTTYIVPEEIRASHPERIDFASAPPGASSLLMSPWEPLGTKEIPWKEK